MLILAAHVLPGAAYWWHNRLAILADYVAERHLGALVRISPDLWVIDVWNLLDSDCTNLELHFKT